MTDPVRLIDQGRDDLGLRLLRSAESDGPNDRSWQRALAAAAAASAATTATSTVSAGSGVVVILKWLGIGALAGSVVAVSADRLTRPHRDASELPATTADRPTHPSPEPPLDPKTANHTAPPTTDPEPTIPTTPHQPTAAHTPTDDSPDPPLGPSVAAFEKPPGSADTLADELRRLDRARTKLAGGDPAAALTAITDYERAYPCGRLLQEAALLRVEALAASGRCTEAATQASGFLTRHPESVLARRARTILARCR